MTKYCHRERSNFTSAGIVCGEEQINLYHRLSLRGFGALPNPKQSSTWATKKYSKNMSMNENQYYIYIMTNQDHTVLYTGVTNDLQRRVFQHRSGKGGKFSKKYKLYDLLYFESGSDITQAISRENQIKAGSRKKKMELIISINPDWEDLSEKYFSSSFN